MVTELQAVEEIIADENRADALREFEKLLADKGITAVFQEWYVLKQRGDGLKRLCAEYAAERDHNAAIAEQMAAEIKANSATNAYIAARMHELVFDLARCGRETHKDKNEVILEAIAELMRLSRGGKQRADSEDIPF